MAILTQDIKLIASQVMDDVPEGGGAPTPVVILDGVSNAIFPDISELDRAGGSVDLRKVFVSIQTDTVDGYYGGNVIIAEGPTDPRVSVTLFSTKDVFDRRDSAKNRIESYLTQGPEVSGFLLENHIAGQRAIQIFQRPNTAPPVIGGTLVLVQNEGLSTEVKQYARVTRTSSVTGKYYDATGNGGDYDAMVTTAEISDVLRTDFKGSKTSRTFTRASDGTRVRTTLVADAGTYSGVSPLVQAVALGALSANVASIYTQLVPSAQTEIPLVDYNAAGQSNTITASSNGSVTYSTTQSLNATTALSVGNSIMPGTLSISAGSAVLTDSGGQIFEGSTVVGLVDYARGTITFAAMASSYSGTKTIKFTPASAPIIIATTAQRPVMPETRSYNTIVTLLPTPAPGSVIVSYRANDNWYDLRDDGGGALKGLDSSFGVGTVNYATGTVLITAGALPDVGSSIIFGWNSPVNYINRSALTVAPASVKLQIANPAISPGSVVVQWSDGTQRTAIDDGKGALSGDATGVVYYDTGLIELVPATLPAGGQEYSVSYDQADIAAIKSDSFFEPSRHADASVTIQLSTTNITPGTVALEWTAGFPENGQSEVTGVEKDVLAGYNGRILHQYTLPSLVRAKDDGNGNIVDGLGRMAGTINYATGAISLQPDGPVVGQERTSYFFKQLAVAAFVNGALSSRS